MSSNEWRCVRLPLSVYEQWQRVEQKVGGIMGLDMTKRSSRVEVMEAVCAMLNSTPLERLKKEFE